MEKALPEVKVTERIVSIAPVVKLNVNSIMPNPEQPRKYFEPTALILLAETIKTRGDVEDPVKVSPYNETHYMLVDGERRWRAAKIAGVSHISSIIKSGLSKNEMHEISALLNFCKADMTYLEKAEALDRIMKNRGINQAQLSKVVGLSPQEISNYLRALNLHPEIKQLWREAKISNIIAMNLAFHHKVHQPEIFNALTELLSEKHKVGRKRKTDAIAIARMIRKIAEEKGYAVRRRKRGKLPNSSYQSTAKHFERIMDAFCTELSRICDLETEQLRRLENPSARMILQFIEVVQERLQRAETTMTEKIEQF
jgi:ParB/RepB/Spo0J family partition protein